MPGPVLQEEVEGMNISLAPMPGGSAQLLLHISSRSGNVERFCVRGQDLLASPLTPCLFRACTDNDRGGMQVGRVGDVDLLASPHTPWRGGEWGVECRWGCTGRGAGGIGGGAGLGRAAPGMLSGCTDVE